MGFEAASTVPRDGLALQCLSHLSFVPRDYQVNVASRVLGSLFGRAILADEVGLGKTIEAMLVLKELRVRGRLSSALILVPATLVEQWKEELENKAAVTVATHDQPRFWTRDVVLMSLSRAKMTASAGRLSRRSWDLVIVDEAHALKNASTVAHRFVKTLDTRRLLLLTATPIENDLRELFNLLCLVDPAAYPSFRRFSADFLRDRFLVKDIEGLRRFCSRYLVRNRRAEVFPEMPPRMHRTVPYRPYGEETRFLDAVVRFGRQVFKRAAGRRRGEPGATQGHAMLLVTLLLKEGCSSPHAVLSTLEKASYPMLKPDEVTLLDAILSAGRSIRRTAKIEALVAAIQELGESAVVYVEYMATHEQVRCALEAAGIHVIPFTGVLSQVERTVRLGRFRSEGGVLLCSEVGGQGLNLQHCRVVVNYDIPWNPMKLEQRIGRIHRFGQERPIDVLTLLAPGTYEDHIVQLLDRKLGLFSQVVGEVEAVLSFMEGEQSLQHMMAEAICDASDAGELRENFGRISARILEATGRYRRSIEATSVLLDGRAKP
jgi:SNF2 family DNA or RNA helicase